MASFVYNKFKKSQLDASAVAAVDFDTDTLKVMMSTSTYTPDQDVHAFLSDVTNQVSGTGYASGGTTLSGVSVTLDTANDRVDVSSGNPTWSNSTITARYAVIYKAVGTTASASPLIALIDFGSDQSSAAGSFTIQWSTPGFLRLA